MIFANSLLIALIQQPLMKVLGIRSLEHLTLEKVVLSSMEFTGYLKKCIANEFSVGCRRTMILFSQEKHLPEMLQ